MSDSSLRPVRSLVMMLRSPRLRAAFADLIGSAPSASNGAQLEAFVRSGIAERSDGAEPALNERLSMFVTDVAFFRRHGVDTGVLERTADGALYWLADRSE